MKETGAPWINVEIVDIYPTSIGHCPHFNLLASELSLLAGEFCDLSNQVLEYPKHVMESHHRAAKLIGRMKEALKNVPVNVRIEFVEATSLRGFARTLRHGLRNQCGVIVNGKKVCDGYPAEGVIEAAVRGEAFRFTGSFR